ncbi:uncharacterized protein METZ01_LOCUS345474, partial [marine metagenome]
MEIPDWFVIQIIKGLNFLSCLKKNKKSFKNFIFLI